MTMSESVAGEIARVNAPIAIVEDMIKAEVVWFGRSLPAGSGITKDQFGTWSTRMITKALNDPKQAEAWQRVLNPANEAGRLSVIVALRECAELGLRPGSEYHLVPFGSTVTGITDYHGEVRLITNHEPCSVVARLVYSADKFQFTGNTTPPVHAADVFAADRGEVIGGYGYVAYPGDRFSQVTAMTEAEFLKHREVAKTKTVWDAWPEAMRRKTIVHAVRDTVPWSAERKW
jgi:recombinational DNA repair protein RecT